MIDKATTSSKVRVKKLRLNCNSINLKIAFNETEGFVFSTQTNKLCYVAPEDACRLAEAQKLLDNNVHNDQTQELEVAVNEAFADAKILSELLIKSFTDKSELGVLEIVTQTDCNLRCKYCYAEGGSYEYGRKVLDPKMVSKYITSLVKQYVESIGFVKFFGGEPTGNAKAIIEACQTIEILVEQGKLKTMPLFGVVTNGTYYSDELAETFKKYNFWVTFSLDGWKEINDMQRINTVRESVFDTVICNIKKYLDWGLQAKNIGIEATYTQNHLEAGITPEEIIKYFVEEQRISKVMVAPCIGETKLGLSDSEIYQMQLSCLNTNYKNLKDQGDCLEMLTLDSIRRMAVPYASPFRCATGHDSVSVSPDGNLFPCHMFLNDKYCFGKYEDDKWVLKDCKQIINNLAAERFVTKAGRCSTCWAQNICLFCPGLYMTQSDEKIFGNGIDCFRALLLEKHLLQVANLTQGKSEWHNFENKLQELYG